MNSHYKSNGKRSVLRIIGLFEHELAVSEQERFKKQLGIERMLRLTFRALQVALQPRQV